MAPVHVGEAADLDEVGSKVTGRAWVVCRSVLGVELTGWVGCGKLGRKSSPGDLTARTGGEACVKEDRQASFRYPLLICGFKKCVHH